MIYRFKDHCHCLRGLFENGIILRTRPKKKLYKTFIERKMDKEEQEEVETREMVREVS